MPEVVAAAVDPQTVYALALRTPISADASLAVGATPTKAEFDAVVERLNDIAQLLKNCGIAK